MEYVKALDKEFIEELKQQAGPRSMFHQAIFDGTGEANIVLLGVKEDRLKEHYKGVALAPDEVRRQFYKLVKPRSDIPLADLGNIEPGNTISDTYFALTQTLLELHRQRKVVILLGGSQDMAYAQFAACEGLNPNLNLLVADSRVDMSVDDDDVLQSGFLSRIISHPKHYLFNITHIAQQGYFVEPESYDAFERMNFDMIRLGNLRNKINETEPLCRNADMMVMNLSVVKLADAPGQCQGSPNGLSAEECCQLARYAGMGNDMQSFALYDMNPLHDQNGQTAMLCAQALWYFLEGYTNRKNDYPSSESKDYLIYRTISKNREHEIVFYKNTRTERWWMEVPYPRERSSKSGSFMVPCSYSDYEAALNEAVPDRWMKTYLKLL